MEIDGEGTKKVRVARSLGITLEEHIHLPVEDSPFCKELGLGRGKGMRARNGLRMGPDFRIRMHKKKGRWTLTGIGMGMPHPYHLSPLFKNRTRGLLSG